MLCSTRISPAIALFCLFTAGSFDRAEPEKVRVGTYDSRAIAVAYASSRFSPVAEKMREFELAKQANDKERVRTLEAWGEKHQRGLHRQGFARVPVDDLLAPASVYAEILVAPYRTGHEAVAEVDVFLADFSVEVAPVTAEGMSPRR